MRWLIIYIAAGMAIISMYPHVRENLPLVIQDMKNVRVTVQQ